MYHSHYWPLEWELPGRNKNSCYVKVICHIPDHVWLFFFLSCINRYVCINTVEQVTASCERRHLSRTRKEFWIVLQLPSPFKKCSSRFQLIDLGFYGPLHNRSVHSHCSHHVFRSEVGRIATYLSQESVEPKTEPYRYRSSIFFLSGMKYNSWSMSL